MIGHGQIAGMVRLCIGAMNAHNLHDTAFAESAYRLQFLHI
jgi:hypothetical protein